VQFYGKRGNKAYQNYIVKCMLYVQAGNILPFEMSVCVFQPMASYTYIGTYFNFLPFQPFTHVNEFAIHKTVQFICILYFIYQIINHIYTHTKYRLNTMYI
jgi:hypothetical protein